MKIKTLLTLGVLLTALSANAFTIGKINYDIIDEANSLVQIGEASGDAVYTNISSSDLQSKVTYNGKTYSVIGVGAGAFAAGTLSGNLVLPEGIIYIDEFAFERTTGNGITIPASVTMLSEYAFLSNKLASFAVASDNPEFAALQTTQSNTAYTFLTNKTQDCIIAAPGQVKKSGGFSIFGGGNVTTVTIPNQITKIADNAFYGNTTLTAITLHKGINYFGRECFCECTALKSATLLNPNAYYGDAVFADDQAITSVSLPDGMPEIPRHMFFCCSGITRITLPSSIKSIRIMGLSNTSISSINLPDGLELLDSCALQGTNLTSINLKNVKKLGNQCFSQCTSLASITGGDKLEEIGSTCFTNTALKDAQIPANVKRMYGGAYFRCTTLTSATIPATLEYTQRNPFTGCTQLPEVKVAAGAQHYAEFDSCLYEIREGKPYKLVCMPQARANKVMYLRPGTEVVGEQSMREVPVTEFIAQNGLKTIETNAFSSSKDLTTVVLPATTDSLCDMAFKNNAALVSVTVLASNPPKAISTSFSDEAYANATLYVPKKSQLKYQKAACWKRFSKIVGIDVDEPALRGDINRDGMVDIFDVNELINTVLGQTETPLELGDLTGDGVIDIFDVNELINLILG